MFDPLTLMLTPMKDPAEAPIIGMQLNCWMVPVNGMIICGEYAEAVVEAVHAVVVPELRLNA